jgi:hypothetical protein
MMMYRVTGWALETRNSMGEITFSGIVYTQAIVLDKIRHAKEFTVEMKYFYRDHKPMDHMTWVECV